MATIQIFYTWGGRCGSGTSNSFRILRDGTQVNQGTTQISCSADGENTLRNQVLAWAGITPSDTVYVNGSLYQSPKPIIDLPTPPVTSPPGTIPQVTGCMQGTTRSIKCPKNQQMITQQCIGGIWVTIKADENKCEDPTNMIIVAVILVVVIIYLASKAR